VSFVSQAARHASDPQAQIHEHRWIAKEQGRDFDESLIPDLPAFEKTTPTEVLLLHEIREPDNRQAIVPFNFQSIWQTIDLKRKFEFDVDTLVDLAGDPTPGFSWVAFDPLGIVIGEEQDFRADRMVSRETYPESLDQGHMPGSFNRQQNAVSLAGLELFTALSTIPAVVYDAWVQERNHPLRPVIPRLEACAQDNTHPGVIEMHWWPDSGIRTWPQRWTYNHYGHSWVIPKVRRLT